MTIIHSTQTIGSFLSIKSKNRTVIELDFCEYPWLGIGADDVTPEAAEGLDLRAIYGVLIGNIVSGFTR